MINFLKSFFKKKQTVLEGTGKLDYELSSTDSQYRVPSPPIFEESPVLPKPTYVPVSLIFFLIFLVVLVPLLQARSGSGNLPMDQCANSCRISLVESIPLGLTYGPNAPRHMSTYEAWNRLISLASYSIDIGSFYWTLQGSDVVPDPTAAQGEDILDQLIVAGTQRDIKIRIAQNLPREPSPDINKLETLGAAKVRTLDFNRLVGAGILHTKLWIVDRQHLYVGSANMDWRALTQVKESGLLLENCRCLAEDVQKIFEMYWMLGLPNAKIPPVWPTDLHTEINVQKPLPVSLNGTNSTVYIASSPQALCPTGRTSDLDAILDTIARARKFVHIAVMDYFPTTLYGKKTKFWPVLDNALRKAAVENRIQVRLMGSHWNHTRPAMSHFLRSLSALNSSRVHLETKFFQVPPYKNSSAIPFTRVNHNKYLVTDQSAYIGTSNWAADYFLNTGGVGFVVHGTDHPFRQQLADVFDRDWNSIYAS